MDFDLQKHTIFYTLSGSRLYGTSDENSDYDYRGVCIPPEKYWWGFHSKFSQYAPQDADVCVYGLQKFVQLAAQNNPNVLELLWVPQKYWKQSTPHWETLVENRHLFLSKRCYFTFRGYAHSQLRRMRSHRGWLLKGDLAKPEREDFGLSQQREVSSELITSANELINLHLHDYDIESQLSALPKEEATGLRVSIREFLEHALALSKQDSDTRVWEATGKLLGYDDNLMELLRKERAYQRANKEYKSWVTWKKERNPRRRESEERHGYDTKHAVHLVRLLQMCKEILADHTMYVERPDADTLLMPIKRGEWSYDKLMEYEESSIAQLAFLYEDSKLQHKPQVPKIEDLSIKVAQQFLRHADGKVGDLDA